jgi:hypothetical protein
MTMTYDSIQLRFASTEFRPVQHGAAHYVAAVQNRKGELTALANATADTWDRMTPIVEFVGEKKRTEPYKVETVRAWVKRASDAVGAHPLYLDILRLRPDHTTSAASGDPRVLAVLHEAARKRSMNFVPVLPIGATRAAYMEVVRDSAARDGRGVALRYPIRTLALPAEATHATVLAQALRDVNVDVTCADVLFDLSYLAAEDELRPDYVAEAIKGVLAVGDWRSVVLMGTSMPSMLGEIAEGTVGSIPRREWQLWSAVRQETLSRTPTYGDYVIQHPTPPHDGGGPGMRSNIRYTVQDKTLIARGFGPANQAGREQYRELCEELASRTEFAGSGFSWGDSQIALCASGTQEPGWHSDWRAAGSSHHFRQVVGQLTG